MTANRDLRSGDYFFEDIEVGDRWLTGGMIVTETHVLYFAGLTGDFFDVHMDDDFARNLGFERRIAHGLLGLALVDGLKNRAGIRLRAVASLGWTWDFTAPILIGDRIAAAITVASKRTTRRTERGIAVLDFDVRNQKGETVQKGSNRLMMLRRPSGS